MAEEQTMEREPGASGAGTQRSSEKGMRDSLEQKSGKRFANIEMLEVAAPGDPLPIAPAPGLTVVDAAGATVELDSLLGGGHKLVVLFRHCL